MDLLKNAAFNGNVDKLYQAIGKNPGVLDEVDKKPFVETPLHIAAERGHTNFAVEIMRLKPCFAKRPNEQGWSPMHLALENKQIQTVLRLLETEDIGAELVRVKGKNGVTPLHFVVEQGDLLNLLHEFLSLNPDSIDDKTNQGETALHIAINKGNAKALDLLLRFLGRSWYKSEALHWEEKVLNWKDQKGYTVLHVAAAKEQVECSTVQMTKMLLKCHNIHVNARCLDGKTALDIVYESESVNKEMEDLLIRAGALEGRQIIQINDTTTSMKQQSFKSRLTLLEKVIRFVNGQKTNISTDSRDALLVVAALVATASFQAVLSPPGGLRQADGDSKSLPFSNVGKVVMNEWLYIIFLIFNSTSFWVTIITIFLLLPNGFYGQLLTLPLVLFSASYLFSSTVISPTLLCCLVNFGLCALFILLLLLGLMLLSNRRCFLYFRKLFTRSNL